MERNDYNSLRAADIVAAHANEVLRLDVARETAMLDSVKQLLKLDGNQLGIEGVDATLGH